MINRVEIDFAIPVRLTSDQRHRLCELAQEIAKDNEPDGYVHWQSGCGAKPVWSKADAKSLGKTTDPDAPDEGEPGWDDSVFSVTTACRPRYDTDQAVHIGLAAMARTPDPDAFAESRHRSTYRPGARDHCYWCGRVRADHPQPDERCPTTSPRSVGPGDGQKTPPAPQQDSPRLYGGDETGFLVPAGRKRKGSD